MQRVGQPPQLRQRFFAVILIRFGGIRHDLLRLGDSYRPTQRLAVRASGTERLGERLRVAQVRVLTLGGIVVASECRMQKIGRANAVLFRAAFAREEMSDESVNLRFDLRLSEQQCRAMDVTNIEVRTILRRMRSSG